MATTTKPAADEAAVTVEDDLDITERTSLWLDTNAKLVNVLLGAFIVVALGWMVYRYIHQSNLSKSTRAYAGVLENMRAAGNETDEAKRKDALTGAITAAEDVVKNYPKDFVGRQAQLVLGNAHYELASFQSGPTGAKELDAAREAYQKYLTLTNDPQEKAAAYLALGNVVQDQLFITQDTNKVADAESAYKQAIDLAGDSYLAAQAKLSLARMYQALGNKQADAKKLYEEVAQNRAIKADEKEKPVTLEGDHVIPAEQVREIKNQEKLSFSETAKAALNRMSALPADKAAAPAAK